MLNEFDSLKLSKITLELEVGSLSMREPNPTEPANFTATNILSSKEQYSNGVRKEINAYQFTQILSNLLLLVKHDRTTSVNEQILHALYCTTM